MKKLLRRYMSAFSQLVFVWFRGASKEAALLFGRLRSWPGSRGRGKNGDTSKLVSWLLSFLSSFLRIAVNTAGKTTGRLRGIIGKHLRSGINTAERIRGRAFPGIGVFIRSIPTAAARICGRAFSGTSKRVQSRLSGQMGVRGLLRRHGAVLISGKGRTSFIGCGSLLFALDALKSGVRSAAGIEGKLLGGAGAGVSSVAMTGSGVSGTLTVIQMSWIDPVQARDTLTVFQTKSAAQSGNTLTIN